MSINKVWNFSPHAEQTFPTIFPSCGNSPDIRYHKIPVGLMVELNSVLVELNTMPDY